MLKNKLQSNGVLSKRLLELEVFTFLDAIQFVKNLPYGRNSNRANPDLVLKELRGTCSTKHALIKKLAIEEGLDNVKLYICMFKMNGINTSKLSKLLKRKEITYIPEAHCILQINGQFFDVTNPTSDYMNLKNDVLMLKEIQPEQIGDFKVNYHQEYIKNWLLLESSKYSFCEFWAIREQCILELSK